MLWVLIPLVIVTVLMWIPYRYLADIADDLSKRTRELAYAQRRTAVESRVRAKRQVNRLIDRIIAGAITAGLYILEKMIVLFGWLMRFYSYLMRAFSWVLKHIAAFLRSEQVVRRLLGWLFQLLLVVFLLILLYREFAGLRFAITYFLIVLVVLGVLTWLFPYTVDQPPRLQENIHRILFMLLAAGMAFIALRQLGWIGIAISLLAAGIVWLLTGTIEEEVVG
jgi:hypothetical protein